MMANHSTCLLPVEKDTFIACIKLPSLQICYCAKKTWLRTVKMR